MLVNFRACPSPCADVQFRNNIEGFDFTFYINVQHKGLALFLCHVLIHELTRAPAVSSTLLLLAGVLNMEDDAGAEIRAIVILFSKYTTLCCMTHFLNFLTFIMK